MSGASPRLPGRTGALLAGLAVLLLAVPAAAQWTELGVPVFLDDSDWRPGGGAAAPYSYGGKPQVLLLIDNSLVMNRRPVHSRGPDGINWFHNNQMGVVGGVPNNQYGWDWVPTIYHVVVQALVGDYEDPDPDLNPATRTPWRMRYPDSTQIVNTATLLGGGWFREFDAAANFTVPGTDPDLDFFPLCRDAGGAACGGAFPNWIRRPVYRRSTIYSAGTGREGFFDYDADPNAVKLATNGLLRWSSAADANKLGSQIRFGLMLLDNDAGGGDWNDFPMQFWGYRDDALGPGLDGHLGADANLTIPFATFYGEESIPGFVVPRTCPAQNPNCPRGERDTNDLIIATLLDSAETASGLNLTGAGGPGVGRRTGALLTNNLAGRAPLSALLRDAQIMINSMNVGDPFRGCRQTFIVLITAGVSSLAEGNPAPNYPTSAAAITELAAGNNFGGVPLQGFGLRVKTFVVGINTEDRPVPGGTGQRGADAFLQNLWTAGQAGTIEHQNITPRYVRVDLERGILDGAAAADKNKNNKEMVRQVRDALREKVFRPILEHETVLRRQPFGVARRRGDTAAGEDPLFFLVDPVFRIGQYYVGYNTGAPSESAAEVRAKTPWRGEIKRRRFRLEYRAAENREVLMPDDNDAGNPLVPRPDKWDLLSVKKDRPIWSAFPPNWTLTNIHPNAIGGADKARLAEIMGLKNTTEVDKVLWRLVCPRPRVVGENIGVWPNASDCMPAEVFHSEVTIARPPQGSGDAAWREYVSAYETEGRDATMAYVATGDGQVHAFVVDARGLANQATYERRTLWSWVPYSVLHKLSYLPGMTAGFADTKIEGQRYRTKPDPALVAPYETIKYEPGKDFHVDSTPVVQDLYFSIPGEYRRVLAGGTRGARGYWALDITQASKLQATPTVGYLGEFTPKIERFYEPYDDFLAGTSSQRYEWLGNTWSPPLLGHIYLADSGARGGRNAAMIFTGGLGSRERRNEIAVVDETGQYVYVVDLQRHDLLWREHVAGLCECGAPGCPADKCSVLRPALTSPVVADGLGRATSIKSIYFGNSEGRLFKLITRDGEYKAVDALEHHVTSLRPPAWGYWNTRDGQLDFWDQYGGSGWQASRQPIVVAPAVVKDIDGSTVLVVATGDPDKLTQRQRQQWVFVLRDTFNSVADPLSPTTNVLQSRVSGEMGSPYDAVCNPSESCVGAGCCLSRLLLDPGKRVTGTPLVVFGLVFFTANESVVIGGCQNWNRYLFGMNLLNLHGGLLFDGAGNRTISGWVPGTGAATKAVVPEQAAKQVIAPSFGDVGLVNISASGGSTGLETTGMPIPKCRTESWGQLL